MQKNYTIADLENLFEKEIGSLNPKSTKQCTYKLTEGKFAVGYNKRTKKYYYHIDGMAVEDFETATELLQAMNGYVGNQNEKIVKEIMKSSLN